MSVTEGEVISRWSDLRRLLIKQLDVLESGALTPHCNSVNATSAAITDLKQSIGEFDRLILGVGARVATPSRLARRTSAPG